MKKTAAFFGLLMLLILGAFQVHAEEGDLVRLGLIPDDLHPKVTRSELAVIISRMYTDEALLPCDTDLSDVDSENVYSGYIDYAVRNGLMQAENRVFDPDGETDLDSLLKAFYDKMGYGEAARLSGGYQALAREQGLLKNVGTKESLGKADVVSLMENIINSAVRERKVQYTNRGTSVEYGNREVSLLYECYKISSCKAEILSAEENVTFRVNSSKDDRYPKDATYTLPVGDIDMEDYRYTAGKLYIRDGNVIYFVPDKEYTITATYIYAVNNDTDTESKYLPGMMSVIELYDGKKYRTNQTKDLKVFYNFRETEKPVALSGKCAKVVMKGKELVAIEAWDLEEGGLISEKYEGGFRYVKGTNSSMQSPKFRNYRNVTVYIDGKRGNYSDIKKDSLFDYYIDGNERDAVLIVSEKNIYDTVVGLGADSIRIGKALYPCAPEKLYVSRDGIQYFDSSALEYGRYADAFIDLKGKVRYIRLSDSERNECIGMLEGYTEEDFGKLKIKVYVLSDNPESKVYDLSKKVKLDEKVGTLEELFNSCSLASYDAMYRFFISTKGEVVRIEKPVAYLGVDADIRSNGSIPYNDASSMAIGNKKIYPAKMPLYVLYREDGEYHTYRTTFQAFGNRDTTSGTFNYRFISADNPNVLKYVVLFGPAEKIFLKSTNVFGVVTEKEEICTDGEVQYRVTFLADNGVEREFYIDSDNAARVEAYKPGHLMQFNRGYIVGPEYGNLGTYDYDLTVPYDDIPTDEEATTGFRRGIIRSISDEYIIFEDGSLYGDLYWRTMGTKLFARLNEGDIKLISPGDIASGDEVLYFLSGGSVSAVFVR